MVMSSRTLRPADLERKNTKLASFADCRLCITLRKEGKVIEFTFTFIWVEHCRCDTFEKKKCSLCCSESNL